MAAMTVRAATRDAAHWIPVSNFWSIVCTDFRPRRIAAKPAAGGLRGLIRMKKILLVALAALTLSGCFLMNEDFWDDDYDGSYGTDDADEDCDC